MMKFWKSLLALTVLVVLLQTSGHAQAPAGSGPPGPPAGGAPPCWPPPCVPIDGGLVAVLIAGAAIGGKKMYDLSKENEQIES